MMTMAGQAGSPDARRGWRPLAAAGAVLVVGLGITTALSVITAQGHARTNTKLLALQTRLISDAIAAADPLCVEDLLSSIVTELTGDSPTDDIALIGLKWLN